jgi:N-acetylated-alpha-linked acidic dipeptidase
MRPALLLAASIAVIVIATAWQRRLPAPFGFSDASAARQASLERRFLRLPSPSRIEAAHRYFTAEPHLAGSDRDWQLAEHVRQHFQSIGLEDVTITTHEVLLPWPLETSVEMVAPRAWRASMREGTTASEESAASPQPLTIPYHAYSASGEVTAPVVFAGSGDPADYDLLAAMTVDVRGAIVLIRDSVPYSYRGFKAMTAQTRGAAGILIYSDPADDGSAKGKVDPEGPLGPDERIQRGGIAYDFLVPGDPLTPGWPSTATARRIEPRDAVSLPAILSAPLSSVDAKVLLESLEGPEAPAAWRGALPLTYRVGDGRVVVRLRVRTDERVRPVWTVTGAIRGSERPDQLVIVGNHRDAWLYGGVDPSTGTAAVMELAEAMSRLVRDGWRPKRTILFASWDAEEFSLISSTEWAEEQAQRLSEHAVAYLNLDAAVSGAHFSATAVPSLNRVMTEVVQAVKDPRTHVPVSTAFRDALSTGTRPPHASRDLISNRIGGGSDYAVFLNFLGVPVADLAFRGPYGVYHSRYDTHAWVSRIGDPGFEYHAALVQVVGLLTLRLANADVLPLDYRDYAARIEEYVGDVADSLRDRPAFAGLQAAAREMTEAAAALEAARRHALEANDNGLFESIDRRLIRAERALLDEEGLPGRPWYRHLIFAPRFSYAPETLPAVTEAIEADDPDKLTVAMAHLAAALRRAAAALSDPAPAAPAAGTAGERARP